MKECMAYYEEAGKSTIPDRRVLRKGIVSYQEQVLTGFTGFTIVFFVFITYPVLSCESCQTGKFVNIGEERL